MIEKIKIFFFYFFREMNETRYWKNISSSLIKKQSKKTIK